MKETLRFAQSDKEGQPRVTDTECVILREHACGFPPDCHSEGARLWRGSEESQTISLLPIIFLFPQSPKGWSSSEAVLK